MIAKVPLVMQMEKVECGAACLAMILAYYKKWVPLERVREECGVSRDGSKALNIIKAARNYGMEADGYRYPYEELVENVTVPCIVFWMRRHFIVYRGVKGNKVYINDPAKGEYTMSVDEFKAGYSGICIQLHITDRFVADGRPKSVISFTRKQLKGTGSAIAFLAFTTVIAGVFSVLNPIISKNFIDKMLTSHSNTLEDIFLFIVAFLVFLQITQAIIKQVYMLRINGKLDERGSASFMWHILKLPIAFYDQRDIGDIQNRQKTYSDVASVLVQTLAPIIFNGLMAIVYLTVMLRQSVPMTCVGLASILINVFIANYISKKRINITRVQGIEMAKLASYTVSGIEMVETIKTSGAENGYFEQWADYQAGSNTQSVRFARLDSYLGAVPAIVEMVTSTVILWLGVVLLMQGNFTAGMIMSFQGLLTAFMEPVKSMINAGQTLQEMRVNMERIEDVMDYPEDKMIGENSSAIESDDYKKLSGRLDMVNVSFGYSKLEEPLIQDFNLTIEPGKSVAIVGSSGCGKSTLSKLMTGLYRQWSGEILFDGKPIDEIDKNIFHASVSVVDQNVILFEDTIAENIRLWDETIEDYDIILAAKDAQIHEDIIAREGGYNYRLQDGGKDFSGGQRQRLEIARVLATDATIIILDEATSALDAKTEAKAVNAIKARGVTTIVIAHRLSTIRDCDEIIVLEKGRVVERGTHKELYAKGGLYTELISNE